MNGGAYPGTTGYPVIGRDLTTEENTRNGKKLTFGTSKYRFDKPEMAARYQFGWMDDVTQLFDGNPIDIVSKYVNPDNIAQIDISQFTSDIDYILLNPGEISKDGFVLLSTQKIVKTNDIISNIKDGQYLDGKYITTAGATPNFSSAATSDYAPVKPNSNYQYYGSLLDAAAIVFYNANKQRISGVAPNTGIGTTYNFTTPNNCYYIRYCTLRKTRPCYIKYVGTVNYEDDRVASAPYCLPYENFYLDGANHILQNPYVAFVFLQNYYAYDMPAKNYVVNGIDKTALGVKKLKTQTLNFPSLTDPNTMQLIKTLLGNGTIQKMSVNLSSRNAQTTLKYDTE
jgi:hypothetical protein